LRVFANCNILDRFNNKYKEKQNLFSIYIYLESQKDFQDS